MTFHKPLLSAHVVFGGTNIKADLKVLKGPEPPSLLVATPGRLNDHLAHAGEAGLRAACRGLRVRGRARDASAPALF